MTSSAPVRLGLVGCGLVARRYPKWLQGNAGAEWRVFCDPRPEAAQAFRDEYAPGAAVETDFRAVLQQHELDAVILCSPNALHYEQTCQALERGLHVLCEKPLAVKREHIEDLIVRAKQSGKVVAIAHQRRYMSPYLTARRELTENVEVYGPLHEVHVFMCEGWAQNIVGTWRDDPLQNYGYFGDAGIHLVDIVHYITDRRAERLYAISDKRGRRVEVVTRIVAEFTGGVGWSAHYVGDAHHMREDLHFHCRDADLLLRSDGLWRCRAGKCEPITNLEPNGDPATSLVAAIREGRPIASPPEIALPIFAWNTSVMESIKTGGWVNVR